MSTAHTVMSMRCPDFPCRHVMITSKSHSSSSPPVLCTNRFIEVARAAVWSLAYIGCALRGLPRSGLRECSLLLREPGLRIAVEMLSSCPLKVTQLACSPTYADNLVFRHSRVHTNTANGIPGTQVFETHM